MGLDITVRRITKTPNTEGEYFQLIDNEGNYKNNFPEWTKELEQKIVETWYDFEKYKEQTGINLDDYIVDMQSFNGKDDSYMIVHHKDIELPEWDGKSDYDTYDAERKKLQLKIYFKDIPTMEHETTVLYYEEAGYQRKGLNRKFYQDYRDEKIGYFVWTLDELKRYKEEYCDDPHKYVYPNGDESDIMMYPKDDFQKNIIDKFVEGECVVTFSW